MKNAARLAIASAAFALSAASVRADDLSAAIAAIDMSTPNLLPADAPELDADPALDAFLANMGMDRSALIAGAPRTAGAADLDAARGGATVVLGNQTLEAITSGNVIGGSVFAGAVNVSDSAFSNFTGLGNIAINTGTQVSLQSGINVIINISE